MLQMKIFMFVVYLVIALDFRESIPVAKVLVLLTSDHKVLGLNPTSDRIQIMIVGRFIAESRSFITP